MFTAQALASYLTAAIMTVLNLLVAYLILKRFLFSPILRLLRQRREKIAGELDQAEAKLQESELKLQQAQAALTATGHQSAQLLAESRQQARREAAALLADAKTDADGLLAQAELEAGRLQLDMHKKIQAEAADLAVAIAGRLISHSMDDRLQQELVERCLAEEVASHE